MADGNSQNNRFIDGRFIDGLIEELRASSRRAADLLAAHTEEELLRPPGERRWSAADCIAHLNLSNRSYVPRIEAALRELRAAGRAAGASARNVAAFRLEWNARLLKFWLEPPSRVRLPTGAAFRPVRVTDARAAVEEFVALNGRLEELLGSARGLDLGAAKIVSPFAENMKYSVYSAFVLIAAHNRRHLWQGERAAGASLR